MTKRIGYVLGIVLAALIQARLLPELGLERAINLPIVLLIVTASADRRTLVLAAAAKSANKPVALAVIREIASRRVAAPAKLDAARSALRTLLASSDDAISGSSAAIAAL